MDRTSKLFHLKKKIDKNISQTSLDRFEPLLDILRSRLFFLTLILSYLLFFVLLSLIIIRRLSFFRYPSEHFERYSIHLPCCLFCCASPSRSLSFLFFFFCLKNPSCATLPLSIRLFKKDDPNFHRARFNLLSIRCSNRIEMKTEFERTFFWIIYITKLI